MYKGKQEAFDTGKEGRAMSRKQWDPDEVTRILDMERHPVQGVGSINDIELTKKQLKENGPLAAYVVTHLMMNSENETLQFKCATYVLDRLLGRSTDTPLDGVGSIGIEDKLRDLVSGTVTYSD
jgi:hypothetical protein